MRTTLGAGGGVVIGFVLGLLLGAVIGSSSERSAGIIRAEAARASGRIQGALDAQGAMMARRSSAASSPSRRPGWLR